MVIFKKIADLQPYLSEKRGIEQPLGFVPTMGALHNGHRSLIDKAKKEGKFVICSIFVNPTQFNDKNDFINYPITIDEDIALLLDADCDVLFLPDVEEMYPGGAGMVKAYDFGYLDTVLEGANRPGHFKGVGQIVGRLLEIVQPDFLYLGQKDYQQCMVVRKLIELMGTVKVELVISPTVREDDGLAMSSRNRRLTEPQRNIAGLIYQCLVSIQSKQDNTPFSIVEKECREILERKGFAPEYISLADARDLTLLNDYNKDVPMVALIATKLGNVRLIDNLLLN
jgi:pantoate--beta-alanine ligase